MGLDVYVGTLTRYLAGDWETATAKAARELGLELQVVRTAEEPEDAITDPNEIRPAVLEWRRALADALDLPLEWPEDDDAPYFTDKPDWSGFSALLLLAAHAEHPEIPLPEELPDDPRKHALLRAVSRGRRGLLRHKEPEVPPRYASLYHAELWLPVDSDALWTVPFVTGQEMTMASTRTLLADLHDLSRRLDATPEDLERWRNGGGVGEVLGTIEMNGQTFEQLAPGTVAELGRFALGVILELADEAVDHRLPVKLDY